MTDLSSCCKAPVILSTSGERNPPNTPEQEKKKLEKLIADMEDTLNCVAAPSYWWHEKTRKLVTAFRSLRSERDKLREDHERMVKALKALLFPAMKPKTPPQTQDEEEKQGWDERHWEYHCGGCFEPHPSFWKTVVTSEEWKRWEAEQHRRMEACKCFDNDGKVCTCVVFDFDESRETNALSPQHWKAFVDFIRSLPSHD